MSVYSHKTIFKSNSHIERSRNALVTSNLILSTTLEMTEILLF